MAQLKVAEMLSGQIHEVARLQEAAFAGSLNTRIGSRYTVAFIRWFCESDEAIALVAMTDHSAVVGYVVGAPVGYTTRLNRHVLWPALSGIVVRPWLVLDGHFRRSAVARFRPPGAAASTPDPPLPGPVFSLVGIGVLPEARGKQIGSLLLSWFERTARERGARTVRLSVYPDNIAARRVYEKHGWESGDEPKERRAMTYYKILHHE